ncbi:MAG: DUF2235 domain-containing protein, partial [Chloroflexota bacterium]
MLRQEKPYTIKKESDGRRRNFFVLMDGTWNDENGAKGSGLITNVVKLFRSLEEEPSAQIARYFRGVGNDDEYGWAGRLFGGAFGNEEQRIRNHAYATIVKEYKPGDRLFIFGFSRGAASARMLASQLAKEGIPDKIIISTEVRANNA